MTNERTYAVQPRTESLVSVLCGVRQLIRRDPWVAGFFIFCGLVFMADILGPELFGKGKTKDFHLWFDTGRAVLEGGDIYVQAPGGHLNFLYTPFAAILLAPFALWGKPVCYALLGLVNWVAWMAAIVCCLRYFPVARLNRWVVALPSALIINLITETFDLGQPNMILLAFVLLGFAAIEERRPESEGGL